MKDADAAAKAWKSLSCKVAYSYRQAGRDGAGEAELTFAAEGAGVRRKVRMRAEGTLGAPDGRRFSAVVEDAARPALGYVVLDRDARTFERRVRGARMGETLAPGPRVFDLTRLAASEFLRIGTGAARNEKVELKLAGTETAGGVLCDAVEVAVASTMSVTRNGVAEERTTHRVVRYAFGRQDRLIRALTRTGGADAGADGPFEKLEAREVRVDPAVAAGTFELDVEGLTESPFGAATARPRAPR